MKKQRGKNTLSWIKAILLVLFLMSLGVDIYAQPGPPSGHGQNGDQGAGGMAPLGEGLIYLMAGAVVYATRKWLRKKKAR